MTMNVVLLMLIVCLVYLAEGKVKRIRAASPFDQTKCREGYGGFYYYNGTAKFCCLSSLTGQLRLCEEDEIGSGDDEDNRAHADVNSGAAVAAIIAGGAQKSPIDFAKKAVSDAGTIAPSGSSATATGQLLGLTKE